MRTSLRPIGAVLTVLAALAGLTSSATVATATVLGPSLPAVVAVGLPTALTLAADPIDMPYGGWSTLTGRLSDPATGSGVAGAPVHLETRTSDGGWVEVALVTTDGSGAVSSPQSRTTGTVYRLRHGDPGTPEVSTSPEVSVSVHPVLTALLSRDAVRVGQPVTVAGVLAPARRGVSLRLERRSGAEWQRVAATRTAADGSYALSVTPTAPAFWALRVVRADGSRTVRLPTLDVFRLHRYSVTTRGGIRADMAVFRAGVAATYADPRGWLRAHHRFRAVERGGEFTVVLSQAQYLPAYSSVCSSQYSCRVGRNVVINQDRWRHGSPYFPGTLEQYRRMVVNHETGHWLGRGHAFCSADGRLAPVMQQQSKGLHGCRVNPWPLPREVRAVS